MNVAYKVVSDFEQVLANYTGSPYVVTVDSCSNALFLCLKYLGILNTEIAIPSRTYMSVPCSIIHSGNSVKFDKNHSAVKNNKLTGKYQLKPLPLWDSALSFTRNMYLPGQFMCLSFTGAFKHLKLGKGGAILTDSEVAYRWLKRVRYMGRNEVPHTVDSFDMLGWNFYMLPEIAARGLVLMLGMGDNEDLSIEYQDLSKYKVFSV